MRMDKSTERQKRPLAVISLPDPRYVTNGYLRRCRNDMELYASKSRVYAYFPGDRSNKPIGGNITARTITKYRFNHLNPVYLSKLLKLVKKDNPRAVICEGYQTLLAGLILRFALSKRLIYNAQNFETGHLLALGSPRWPLAFVLEFITSLSAAFIIAGSNRDRRSFCRLFPWIRKRITTIENTVDIHTFSPGGEADEGRVLFSGGEMSYPPNRKALPYLRKLAVELKRTKIGRLYLAGKGTEALSEYFSGLSNVILLGHVDDMAAEIRKCSLAVAPLTHSGATQFKVLEAMACGVATLISPAVAKGLEAGDAVSISPLSEFHKAALRLLSDRRRRQSLGRKARRVALAKYSLSSQLPQAEKVFRIML